MEELVEEKAEQKTIDNDGNVEVQVAVVGTIVGSDTQGNPVKQNITEESLEAIAKGLNESGEEVLVDADHQSAREGLDRDTRAMGWLSKFWTNAKGLFAKLRLTPTGKAAVEGREYRKLSPVFGLDKDGKPTSLESCAFTNTPAMQDIEPILNQKPNEAIAMEMTKEELIELIKETVGAIMEPKKEQEPAEEQEIVEKQEIVDEKPAEEQEEKQETVEEQKTVEEKPIEEAENACGKEEEKEEEAVSQEPEEQEKPVEQKKKKEQKKEEVIKEAALNSMPTKATVGEKPWGSLKGEELLAWAYRNHI